MATKSCATCKREIHRHRKLSEQQWRHTRYCSRKCSGRAIGAKRTAAALLGWRERFLSRVRKGRGCWPYTRGRVPYGYGAFTKGGANNNSLAHRVAYEIAHGPIPPGMQVCHHCDNPPCCRPSHLFLGTVRDNSLDSMRKGRRPHGEQNKRSKLTESDVREIRRLRATGMHQWPIARRFGVTQSTVWSILSGRGWKHVT